jgi:phage tail sheath protein FI
MPDYFSPGVFVEEVPSSIKPIAGTSTSTAAFIGFFEEEGIKLPGDKVWKEKPALVDQNTKLIYRLNHFPVIEDRGTFAVFADGKSVTGATLSTKRTPGKSGNTDAIVTLEQAPSDPTSVEVDYVCAIPVTRGPEVKGELVGTAGSAAREFRLRAFPVLEDSSRYSVNVGEVSVKVGDAKDAAKLRNDWIARESKVELPASLNASGAVTVGYTELRPVAPAGEARLCTSFSEFASSFGGFSASEGQKRLAHAVYGFFANGGSRCYVIREEKEDDIGKALAKLLHIEDISIVAAPGAVTDNARAEILQHCQIATGDRFAILDCVEQVTGAKASDISPPARSTFAAVYHPWLQVFDPVKKALYPNSDGMIYVPPSGHVAGIYARTDSERGVHKAPANSVVMGALGLKYSISKSQQDGLNPQGIMLNGNIQVWGARTIGGDANNEFKYVNVRRLLLFLKKSIEQGTQWAVFEPNSPALWQTITRNVSAFLTDIWRSGALFGTTPGEAFYVRCDESTNPASQRELGRVVTEVGVAIVRPAEFVIFRITQAGGASA